MSEMVITDEEIDQCLARYGNSPQFSDALAIRACRALKEARADLEQYRAKATLYDSVVQESARVQRELEEAGRRLNAVIENGWQVSSDPRRNGRYVCGHPYKTWPNCIAGEGATADDAIDAAIAQAGEEPNAKS